MERLQSQSKNEKWINAETNPPRKEGNYLTIREYNYGNGVKFSTPKVCEFKFVKYRSKSNCNITNGKRNSCWVDPMNNGTIVDYYMELPKNPYPLNSSMLNEI